MEKEGESPPFSAFWVEVVRILSVDQARHGGWAVFDYEERRLLKYGAFDFDNRNYTFEQAILRIEALVDELINAHGVSAVFIEDIQLRKNPQSFKRLAQLQGVLVNLFEKNEYLYDIIQPSQWQGYCNARGRTEKEIKAKVTSAGQSGKKSSKVLSIQFVRDRFKVETDNDNLSDAICIGWYCVNNINIRRTPYGEGEEGT